MAHRRNKSDQSPVVACDKAPRNVSRFPRKLHHLQRITFTTSELIHYNKTYSAHKEETSMERIVLIDERPDKDNLLSGFVKLWQGFCDPSKIAIAEQMREGSHGENHSFGQRSIARTSLDQFNSRRSDVEVDPYGLELKATNSGRRKRISRGLGVGGLGILSVVVTIWILLNMDENFTGILNFQVKSSELYPSLPSKPWIQIHYNSGDDLANRQPSFALGRKNANKIPASTDTNGSVQVVMDFDSLSEPSVLHGSILQRQQANTFGSEKTMAGNASNF